jgi:hypothetical protein
MACAVNSLFAHGESMPLKRRESRDSNRRRARDQRAFVRAVEKIFRVFSQLPYGAAVSPAMPQAAVKTAAH